MRGFLALLVMAAVCRAQSVITTVAGTDAIFADDGKPATQARISQIQSVAVDRSGNVYTGDPKTAHVFRIAADGVLSVIAGNGISGNTGDGDQARRASFSAPIYVAVGPDDSIYVADPVNLNVRKIGRDGVVTTVAGRYGNGYDGDGGPALRANFFLIEGIAVARDGTVYVSDTNRVRRIRDGVIERYAGNGSAVSSGDGGPAIEAGMQAVGIDVDEAGNLFIADANGRIRLVTPDGMIRTLAAGLRRPLSVAVDRRGNVYAGELGLVSLIAANGSIRRVAGSDQPGFSGDGGPAVAAALGSGVFVGVDGEDRLLIADAENLRLRRVEQDGTIQTIAGLGQSTNRREGAPAVFESFGYIGGMAIDSQQNVYVSDLVDHTVRRVSQAGLIETVAGTGIPGDAGDDGPGRDATLAGPGSLAVDKDGQLYISSRSPASRRIRRLGADGIIRRAVGKPGGGLVPSTPPPGTDMRDFQIGSPTSVTFGPSGNLYYVDPVFQTSVSVVTPEGRLAPFACVGTPGLQCPRYAWGNFGARGTRVVIDSRIAVAPNGTVFMTAPGIGLQRVTPEGALSVILPDETMPATAITVDNSGSPVVVLGFSIYRLRTDGTLERLAGNDQAAISGRDSGDGGPASEAGILPGSIGFDAAGNLYIADLFTQRVRMVPVSRPVVAAGPASLVFDARSEGPVTLAQTVSLTGSIPSLQFQARAEGDWLKVAVTDGLTPRLIEVSADPSGMAPGEYTGKVVLTIPLATPSTIEIPVVFRVGTALPAKAALDRQNFSFAFPRGGTAREETLVVSNTGGGEVSFTVQAETVSGGRWLSVVASSNSATPNVAATVAVSADPGNLPPQTYRGSVTIATTAGETIRVPVTMTVSDNGRALLLSQSGLSFTAVKGGGVTPSRSFDVLNIGSGQVDWTVGTSTLSGGQEWLRVDRMSGSSVASAAAPAVRVSVDAANLEPGAYYGLVRVESPGSANTPQAVTVFLNVLPEGSDPGAMVDPAELVFTMVEGGPRPGSKTFTIYNIAAEAKTYRSTAAFDGGLGPVAVLPSDARLDPNQPTEVVVQPLPTTRPAVGVHPATVNLQLSDGTVRQVRIKFIVLRAAPGSASEKAGVRKADGCEPSVLTPSVTSLAESSAVTAGWPVPIEVSVLDDCGQMVSSGAVTVSFSTGDVPISLRSLNDGRWANTWTIAGSARTRATVKVEAKNGAVRGESTVQLGVNQPQEPPVFTTGSVVSAAGGPPFTPIAPGSLITIKGERLAEATAVADGTPLPVELGNAQLIVGGVPAGLVSVSASEIRAVVPFEVGVNTTQQLILSRGLTYSRAVQVDVAPAQPGVLGARSLAGGAIEIEAVGLGVSLPGGAVAGEVVVLFGEMAVTAESAVLGSGPGRYLVRVRAPQGVLGEVGLRLRVSGQTSEVVNVVVGGGG